MWIFFENDLVSILSVSHNLALLFVAAGHKLSVIDNRYFGVKQIKFHASHEHNACFKRHLKDRLLILEKEVSTKPPQPRV